MDLSKAFDLVNHTILLYKLNYYGVRGQVLQWFESYLSNREQYTYVNNIYSDARYTNIGVPQGSVLGPLLFLIYVNDIEASVDNTEIRSFADDTNILIFHKNLVNLQLLATHALEKLTKWFEANHLTVNYSKTCFSVFSNKCTNHIQHLSWNNNKINRVTTARYLGVHVDEKLLWTQHIDFVCKKLTKLTYVFRVLAKYIERTQICQLYFAYVYPHINYAIEVYGACSKTVIKSLQVTQNNLLRALLRVNYRYSATQMHKELGLLKLCHIFEKSVLIFVYRQRNELLPSVFDKYYQTVIERNKRSTSRRITDLYVDYARTTCGTKSLKIIGAKLWNQLPSELKEVKGIYKFKKMLRKHLRDF